MYSADPAGSGFSSVKFLPGDQKVLAIGSRTLEILAASPDTVLQLAIDLISNQPEFAGVKDDVAWYSSSVKR
jgi:hypothetical protein